VLDLQGDEGVVNRVQRASQLKWDRKRKRFTQERDQTGEKGKMIKTESGALLPATFDSGRYREWKSRNRNTVVGPDRRTHMFDKSFQTPCDKLISRTVRQTAVESRRKRRGRSYRRQTICGRSDS
jgi:hypothetical protein